MMPDFTLADPSGVKHVGRDACGPKGLLIAFTCNHCPYARAVWPRLITLARAALPLGVATVAINPNIHPDYPADAPERMRDKIAAWGIAFPYLVDESQQVARAFDAQCTPDLYLYDGNRRLFYHGRLDDNWKDPERVTQEELKNALVTMVSGGVAPSPQNTSMGCSIKWRR